MQLLMQCHLPEWRCFFLYHDFIMFLITSNKSPEPHEVTSIIIQLVELSQCFCPVRSIWIYRVIRWNHGNHHPKQLLLNFWGFKKKLLKNLHGEVQSWFVRGVSLQQWDSWCPNVAVFRVCMFFFRYISASTAPATFLSYTMHKCVSFCWMQKQNFPHFLNWQYVETCQWLRHPTLTDRPCLMPSLEELNSAMAWNFWKATW